MPSAPTESIVEGKRHVSDRAIPISIDTSTVRRRLVVCTVASVIHGRVLGASFGLSGGRLQTSVVASFRIAGVDAPVTHAGRRFYGATAAVGSSGEVHFGRGGGNVAFGFEQSRLQVEDVLAQLEVFVLEAAIVLLHLFVVFDLFFELLDVAFLALTERALRMECQSTTAMKTSRRGTDLCGSILSGSLTSRQLSFALGCS